MSRKQCFIFLMMWLLATTVAAQAQDVPAPASAPDPSAAEAQALTPAEAAELKLEIEARLNQFADDFNDLYLVNNMKLSFDASGGIPESMAATLSERMKRLNASFNYLDIKWNTYYQAQQLDIAADDDLMEKATALEIAAIPMPPPASSIGRLTPAPDAAGFGAAAAAML